MKYQIISDKLINNGGNSTVHITEVWLQDDNRTVFIYTGDCISSMLSVDYLSSDIKIDDIEQIELEVLNYRESNVQSDYFELHRNCLFRYIEELYNTKMEYEYISYEWLPENIQQQITEEQRQYVEDSGLLYSTNGCRVKVPTDVDDEIVLFIDHKLGSLKDTLSASLDRLKDKAMIDKEYMDDDDYGALLVTIKDLEYWLSRQ